jgi:hypothetical protein
MKRCILQARWGSVLINMSEGGFDIWSRDNAIGRRVWGDSVPLQVKMSFKFERRLVSRPSWRQTGLRQTACKACINRQIPWLPPCSLGDTTKETFDKQKCDSFRNKCKLKLYFVTVKILHAWILTLTTFFLTALPTHTYSLTSLHTLLLEQLFLCPAKVRQLQGVPPIQEHGVLKFKFHFQQNWNIFPLLMAHTVPHCIPACCRDKKKPSFKHL